MNFSNKAQKAKFYKKAFGGRKDIEDFYSVGMFKGQEITKLRLEFNIRVNKRVTINFCFLKLPLDWDKIAVRIKKEIKDVYTLMGNK